MGSVRTGSDSKEEVRGQSHSPPGRFRDARAKDTDHVSPQPPACSAAFWLSAAAYAHTLPQPARLRSHLERLLPGHMSLDKATPLSLISREKELILSHRARQMGLDSLHGLKAQHQPCPCPGK